MSDRNILEPEKSFRLSIITQFYPPDYAATGQLIEELATQLGNIGVSVKVFTGQPGYAFKKKNAPAIERSEQVVVQRSRIAQIWPTRIRGKAINGVLFCIRSGLHLLKFVLTKASRNQLNQDILLLTTAPPFLPIIGYLANLFFDTPYVCLLYDLYPDIAIELNVLKTKNNLAQFWDFLNTLIWQKATKIIVLSPSMKERVAAKCPEIANKITVIHNWANPDWIVPIAKEKNWFAHQMNLVNKFTVLYSGNMGLCHDMETILEAVKILKNEPIQFVFIGSGAKRQPFIDEVNRLGLDNCQFLPYQDKENLPYSLTACDLSLVSVSLGMEGLVVPSKLYASLASGRPIAVICEKHSYLCELINEAGCGGAFTNGDSQGLADFILQLAKDTHLAQKMGNAGRSYLELNFTPEIIAKQYSRTLSQALLEASASDGSLAINVAPEFVRVSQQDLRSNREESESL